MANVFAILSALALLAAAFLAMKNKEAYATEIDNRKNEQSRLEKSKTRLTSLQTEFNETEKTRKETQEATIVLRETEATQQKKNKGIEDDIASKKTETDSNATKIAEIEDKLKEIGNIEELVGKVTRTASEVERLTGEIASNEATMADLQAEKARTEGVIATYRAKDANYSNQRSFFTSTRIGAIYPAYGFVTLPVGNSSGVVSGSPLNVVRDGEVVAKLRVSSVEAGRSAAEIVPDSLTADTVLMVGDQVVPAAAGN
jgi:septal ring factor EnvC (AmiA/AmiB activator)